MSEIYVYGRYVIRANESLTLDGAGGAAFVLSPLDPDNPAILLNHGEVLVSSAGTYGSVSGVEGWSQSETKMGFRNFAGASFTVQAAGYGAQATGVELGGSPAVFSNDGVFTVSSADDDAVGVSISDTTLSNGGTLSVSAGQRAIGIYFSDNGYGGAGENTGLIEVSGATAIGVQVTDNSAFQNHGEIQVTGGAGVVAGVQIQTFFQQATFVNTGSITAHSISPEVGAAAIDLVTRGGDEPCTVENSGVLRGDYGVREDNQYEEPQPVVVDNTGLIYGDISLGFAVDRVVNAGLIKGDVFLSLGDDLYDGRQGVLHGAVYGGLHDDTLLGGKGADWLYGDDGVDSGQDGDDHLSGGKGGDRLFGEDGDDVLIGGKGSDQLTGGYGRDIFAYQRLGDSSVERPDLITDLKAADTIDLGRIDADTAISGDQAFVVVSALHGHAGELALIYDASVNLTRLELDVDGDGQADAVIALAGEHTDFSNFVL